MGTTTPKPRRYPSTSRDTHDARNDLLADEEVVRKHGSVSIGDLDPEVWVRLPFWVKEMLQILRNGERKDTRV